MIQLNQRVLVPGKDLIQFGLWLKCRRSTVFCGDHLELDGLMYRQMSGRAGRRGFDLLGHVIFIDVPSHRWLLNFLKSMKISHYFSLLFICSLSRDSEPACRGSPSAPSSSRASCRCSPASTPSRRRSCCGPCSSSRRCRTRPRSSRRCVGSSRCSRLCLFQLQVRTDFF